VGVPALRRGPPAGRLGVHAGARAAAARGAGLSVAALNGTELAYDLSGDGFPVVLVHAGVGDRRLWEPQADVFAERHLVIRPDLRGFGESPLPGGPFSYVDDLRALLDHVGIDRAAIVGNSFGGRVVLDFALVHPERVAALVLVDSALSGHESWPASEAFDEEEDALLDAGRLDEAVELNLRTWVDGTGRDPAAVPADLRRRVGEMQRRAFEIVVPAFEASPPPGPVGWAEPPTATRLGAIGAPTLIVVGRFDVEEFRAISDRLAAEIRGARKAVLDTAHLPALEQPDEFNRLVLDFLADALPVEAG
jgi:pimeloyl-ACP methyl ester carboxylesterase